MARAPLSQEAIVLAAIELADEHGLAALTMRRLAAELGVEAMSLYNHVANKRDVLEGMVDAVWALIDLALDEPNWRAAIHRLAGSSHRTMLAHPWFLSLPVIYGREARLAVIDAGLSHMRRAGIPAAAAYHAHHVIDGYIFGYTWQAIQFDDPEQTMTRGMEMLARIDTAAMPYLMEHVAQHQADAPPGDGFEFGLNLLLDGLESGR